MLVYVPIATLQGLEGRMFRPMAITVAIALFGSLLLALAFIPAAATLAFRGGARESRERAQAGWAGRLRLGCHQSGGWPAVDAG